MTPEENIKIVESFFEQYEQGKLPSEMEEVSKDIEWLLSSSPDVLFFGTYKGVDAFDKTFVLAGQVIKAAQVVSTDYIAQGDKVVVTGWEKVTYNEETTGNDHEASLNQVSVFTISGGQIIKYEQVLNTAVVGMFGYQG